MQEVDRLMIETYGIELLQMMENAGLNLAELVSRYLDGALNDKRIAVLAGQGNNGGGGLTAARRLSTWGAHVEVVLAEPPEEYRDAPGQQLGVLQQMGVPIQRFQKSLPQHDIIIDAVIGYGLSGPPRGTARDLIAAANSSPASVISLDVPSGVDVDSGEAMSEAIRAKATLTLALPKTGLLQSKARPYVGQLYLADISVPPGLYAKLGLEVRALFADGQLVMINTN